MKFTSPCQRTFQWSISSIRNIFKGYIFLVNLKKENLRLQEKLLSVQKENYELREFVQAVKRLRRLLLFKEQVPVAMIPAEVIAYSPSAWFRTIVINKGRQDGVKKGMPVVTWEGVVGKVIKTSTESSIILLIIDRNSSVDAMVQRNRRRGIFEGDGGPRCQLKYVPRMDDIKVGDFIVTSGLGGVFPKGLFLGKVVRVEKKEYGLFQEVEAGPGVDFSRLEEVMVILMPEEESKG